MIHRGAWVAGLVAPVRRGRSNWEVPERGVSMLIVRHLTGPLAGKEERIDPKSDRVTFGRDPAACDVVYPPDATMISRRHFALVRKPSGEWTFDLFGDPYVGVNGTTADQSQAVHTGDKVGINAHVAEMFEELPAGGALFVRSPGANGKEYKVISASKHPGFTAFLNFMAQDPFFVGRRLDPFPAYDVGILRVEPGTNLGPTLELATREELADL